MKKYILCLSFAIISLAGITQNWQNLVPEAVWHDGNNREWCDKGFGTTFLDWNGVIHVFNYQGNGHNDGGHAYMYTINAGNKTAQGDLDNVKMEDYKVGPSNDHNNKLVFGYPAEGDSYDEGPVLGQTFTFKFDNRAWYFQHILDGWYYSGECNDCYRSFECFAQLPLDDSYKCYTYYRTVDPASQHWKQGGFQLDSLMYFLVYKNDDKYWEIDEHYFSSSDNKFHSNNNDVKFDPTVNVDEYTKLPLSHFPYFGGMVTRLDSLGNPYFVVAFYEVAAAAIGKIVPRIVNGKYTFTWEDAIVIPDDYGYPITSCGAITICEGSIKGNRTANDIPNKSQSDRVIIYGEYTASNSDGSKPVRYWEYHFENDMMVPDVYGTITLPSSRAPHTVKDDVNGNTDYHLYSSYQLIPMNYSDMIQGNEGYQSYVWLIYPDKDRHFNGAMFLSDSWRHDPDLFKESYDLNEDETYDGIQKLWSLMGIIDGAPPASIDWDTWYAGVHGFEYPTMLEFEVDTVGATGFSTDSENEWSIGENIDLSIGNKKRKFNLGEKYKYTQSYENTVKQDSLTMKTRTTPYKLDHSNQDYGFFIYSVPMIKRFTFYTYPWWDNNTLDYPAESSLQYLFQTTSTSLVNYEVSLDKFPFNVSNPNDPTMFGWLYNGGRYFINQQADLHGLQPAFQLDWTDGSGGSTDMIASEKTDETSNKNTRTWEFEVEAGYEAGSPLKKVPDVCKIEKNLSVGAGYKGSLMSETTTTTTYGQRITASLESFLDEGEGVNTSGLHMLGYFFRPEDNPNWWYLDSLDGQKPFYLAWIVTSTSNAVELQTPANGSRMQKGNLFFSWLPDMGELYDYEMLVSKSANICYANAVYRKKMGKATALSATEFKPEPGEKYFWAVQALDDEGRRIYSRIWNFTVPEEETTEIIAEASLKAVVYPNPAKFSDVTIAIDPVTGGTVMVKLFDVNGALVASEQVNALEGSTSIISFPSVKLSAGIYLAVIRTDREQVVKKVVVR